MTTRPPDFGADSQHALHATATSTRWPKNLGVVAVIAGAASALGGLCGALSPLFMGAVEGFVAKGASAAASKGGPDPMITFEVTREFRAVIISSSVLAILIAGLLLWGGITLIKRNRACRQLILYWAALKIVHSLAGGFVGFAMQARINSRTPGAVDGPGGDVFATLQPIMQVLGIMWACALAVFMLVWFSRAKIKSEVATWS